MAYSTSNPPILTVAVPLGGQAGRTWSYRSSDSSDVVDGNGYISNGRDLGMRVGDYVNVGQRQTPSAVSYHTVATVNTNGSVDLSNNLFFSGSQNTD